MENETSDLSDEHWFEMTSLGGGEHYCLKSVVNSWYVSVSKGRESFLELSPIEEYIQVRHEKPAVSFRSGEECSC